MNKKLKKLISSLLITLVLTTSCVCAVHADDSTSMVTVDLKITAQDTMSGLSEMMISNYSDFRDGVWEKYSEEKEWTLLSNKNENIVYIKVKDKYNNISEAFSTTIDLGNDDVFIGLKAAIIKNNTNDMLLKITMPNNEYLKEMKFSSDNINYTEWEQYSTKKEYRYLNAIKGEYSLYIKVKDVDNIVYTKGIVVNKPGIYDNGLIVSNKIDAISGEALGENLGTPLMTIGRSSKDIENTINLINENLSKEAPVYILGGEEAIPNSIEKQLKENGFVKIVRISGKDKNDTSKKIAEYFKQVESRNILILPREKDSIYTQDIVKVSVESQYPIMYSKKTSLTQSTKDTILKLKPKTIYIVGSEEEISESVIKEIKRINNIDVIRVNSKDEIETISVVVNKPGIYDNGIIVSNKIDAISGRALGENLGTPLMTIGRTSKDIENTVNLINENVSKGAPVYILGDEEAIPNSIEKQLKEIGFVKIVRISGKDKNDTSKKIAEYFKPAESRNILILPREKDSIYTEDIVNVSIETQYPIMYSKKTSLTQSTKDTILRLNPKTIYIVGSEEEISESVIKEIRKINNIDVIRVDSEDKIETIK